ncbi:MAG: hypothetical protein KJ062_22695, partial [Thermoanaerobaculia bacterium]|nr:hypothetical protein [Thermoanaerobaculia bacterium]
TPTTPFGSSSQGGVSIPARGRVVSTDETITVPAGTFRTYRIFVERDDLTTTETWLSYEYGMAIRQIDVTSKGSQIIEATRLQ